MAMGVADARYWAYNFTMPSYGRFLTDVVGSFGNTCSRLTLSDFTPTAWFATWKENGYFSSRDLCYFFGLAVFWTVLRFVVTALVLRPLVNAANLGRSEGKKAPESAWKLMFYSSTWAYSLKLLFFSNYDFFFNPPLTFYKWKIGQDVPSDIYWFYMVQLSFYLHSVYGTLFMDVWRKDSKVMLLHHFVTLLLIGFSYSFRFTNIGVLILFLHDVTDIFLEFTKLVLYHKTKGGMWTYVCDAISTCGFVCFGTAWLVFRLYWYPLKAMYAAGYTGVRVLDQEIPFYLFFNALLWTLLCMNIYWFKFIVVMAYRVVSGKVGEIDDTREYSSDYSSESDDSPKRKTMNGHARQNGVAISKKDC